MPDADRLTFIASSIILSEPEDVHYLLSHMSWGCQKLTMWFECKLKP